MAGLFELKKEHHAALTKMENLVSKAENEHREMTVSESTDFDICNRAVQALGPKIASLEKQSTLRRHVSAGGHLLTDGASTPQDMMRRSPRALSPTYFEDFHNWLKSGGTEMGAALYEGSSSQGGYAVPIVVADQIIELAVPEMGVRRLASVVPTVSDIKFPSKSAFGTAAAKAESGGSTNAFGGTQPTLGQFTLSAYMAGVYGDVSWELIQDVPAFQQFAVQDMLDAVSLFEENLFINGTGSGQAQGLLGNTDSGGTFEPDTNGNLVSIDGTLSVLGTLNALYHPGASWLMARQTSIVIRKAQVESNLFNPVWTRVGNQDFLHGYPVEYSSSMPAATRGNTPVLFGDFKRGYLIGDRGGSGINVKILDQPKAVDGLLGLLAYRRMDARVRRSEAIKSYTISAS
jgi:HK97 family phage major capsid protein